MRVCRYAAERMVGRQCDVLDVEMEGRGLGMFHVEGEVLCW